jgi:hypothetical protein
MFLSQEGIARVMIPVNPFLAGSNFVLFGISRARKDREDDNGNRVELF